MKIIFFKNKKDEKIIKYKESKYLTEDGNETKSNRGMVFLLLSYKNTKKITDKIKALLKKISKFLFFIMLDIVKKINVVTIMLNFKNFIIINVDAI